jgi:uncharacterized protein
MDEMTCPKCSGTMRTRQQGELRVTRCDGCSGVFLDRVDLGSLTEAENDWHRGTTTWHTEPLPRITPGMNAPPRSKPRARSFIETLFG